MYAPACGTVVQLKVTVDPVSGLSQYRFQIYATGLTLLRVSASPMTSSHLWSWRPQFPKPGVRYQTAALRGHLSGDFRCGEACASRTAGVRSRLDHDPEARMSVVRQRSTPSVRSGAGWAQRAS